MSVQFIRRLFTVNLFWLALNISSNTIDPILVPLLVQGFVPAAVKNSTLAMVGAAGMVVAMVWQPVAGALSDRSRRGRLPFLLIGTVGLALTLPLMVFAPSLAVLVVAILLAQLASNTIQGPLQAVATDYLPSNMWGRAAGAKTVMEVGGIIVGAYVGGRLVSSGQIPLAYVFVVGALGLAAVVTVLDLRKALRQTQPRLETGRASLRQSLRSPELRPFLWWLLNRYLFLIGLTTIRVFGFYLIQDYLRLGHPARVMGELIATLGIIVVVASLPMGWLADRVGRKPLMLCSMALATVVMPMFLWVRGGPQLYLLGTLLGIAAATFQSVGWAMAMNLVPQAEAGRYLGLSNVASAGGSLTARLGIGLLIDLLNRVTPGWGYSGLILTNTIFFALASLALLRVQIPSEMPHLPGGPVLAEQVSRVEA